MRRLLGRAVIAGCMVVSFTAVSASAAEPGPPLEAPSAQLAAAVTCPADIASSPKQAVLLVHGTVSTPAGSWGTSYMKWLPQQGYPTCTVTIPSYSLDDLQKNVEYVVYAIRKVAQLSGRKIAVLGHSQGAFLPAYALRFWPDLARRIDDFIGFAGTYTYGTEFSNIICGNPLTCMTAFTQLKPGSQFLSAVAAAPMPAGPSYTSFTSRTDEVVIPQPKASDFDAPGVRRYVLQDFCPLDLTEHTLLPNAAAFLPLTLDALTHAGPAVPTRAGRLPCGTPVVPLAQNLTTFASLGAGTLVTYPSVARPDMAEPPLRCYLTHACTN